MQTSRISEGLSSSELAARLDFLNRAFCERLCAVAPAQAHDRPWVTPDARQVRLCQRGNKSKRQTNAGAHDVVVALDLSDTPLYQNSQPVRSDKAVHSKTKSAVRCTTRPMTMDVKLHEMK